MPPSKKQRAAYRKAERIRAKLRDEKEVSVADLEWIDRYEAAKAARGKPIVPVDEKPAAPSEDSEAEAGPDDDAIPDGGDDPGEDTGGDDVPDPSVSAEPPADLPTPDVAQQAPPVGAPPPPAAPRIPMPRIAPPKPPRVHAAPKDDGPKKKERWQDKYKAQAEGREQSVTFLANQWLNILNAMAAQIRASGAQPIVEPAMLYNAMVITLDDVLPANLEVKPEHMAVGGSTALLVQRFMRRKEIGDLERKTKEAAEARARSQARRESTEAKHSAPTPDPVPTAVSDLGGQPSGSVDHGVAQAAVREPDSNAGPASDPAFDPVGVNGHGKRPLTRAERDAEAAAIIAAGGVL